MTRRGEGAGADRSSAACCLLVPDSETRSESVKTQVKQQKQSKIDIQMEHGHGPWVTAQTLGRRGFFCSKRTGFTFLREGGVTGALGIMRTYARQTDTGGKCDLFLFSFCFCLLRVKSRVWGRNLESFSLRVGVPNTRSFLPASFLGLSTVLPVCDGGVGSRESRVESQNGPGQDKKCAAYCTLRRVQARVCHCGSRLAVSQSKAEGHTAFFLML